MRVLDFQECYRTYAADVHRFAVYLSGNAALADDIVSETFLRAWTARERIETATVKAYLLTIARNLFLHARRHKTPLPLAEQMADPGAGPSAQAQSRDELAISLAALQTLPEIDRAALLMRAVDELPYEEIAAALEISVAAAKVKVHRARLKLTQATKVNEP